MESTSSIPGFRPVPKTGVIYVMHRAAERGFSYGNEKWANLGQGAPEVGPLPGGSPRADHIALDSLHYEYAPVVGLEHLRERVAAFYNALYRKGMRSQYTADNVAICSGGRLALTRIASSLGNINMGHFIPDYTAYEELLTLFKAFTPIPLLLHEENGYRMDPTELREEILGLGLGSLLLSNPCNPTGQHIRGEELSAWTDIARDCGCTCIFDEFYSHYVYDIDQADASEGMVSAARYVQDVDSDPVIIVDGLTKNWRSPGFRISWTLGPRSVVELLASAGSFLDGGAPHCLQAAACALLDPNTAAKETVAIQRCFSQKRSYALERLAAMGMHVSHAPKGGFYCWANLDQLPPALRDGMTLFEAGLDEHVITVPGVFFDVNPGKRRTSASRYRSFSRISFGPDMPTLKRGLDALERVIRKY